MTLSLSDRKELAATYSRSRLIPAELQGNGPDCLVLLDLAESIGEPFLRLAHGIGIFKGKMFPKAEFVIGRLEQSGRILGALSYEVRGEFPETLAVRAVATDAATGKPRCSQWMTMEMARQEGWTRNNKYGHADMAEHMLRLRSATFFTRTYYPSVMFGGMTAEEAEDVRTSVVTEQPDSTPQAPQAPVAQPVILTAEELAAEESQDAPQV